MEREDAGALPLDVAREQREVGQRLHGVGAPAGPGDAVTVDDGGASCAGEQQGGLAYLLEGDACDLLDVLGRVRLEALVEVVEAVGPARHELLVYQVIVGDHPGQSVRQSQQRARSGPEPEVGEVSQGGLPRFHQDQLARRCVTARLTA